MKKTALMKELRKIAKANGADLRIERNSGHEIWKCGGFTFPVPRHNEIAEGTARTIIKGLKNHLEGK